MNGIVQINKCPKCGASEIKYDVTKKKLVCEYCRSEFTIENVKQENIKDLKGYNISDGSKTLIENNDLIIVKCANCGAEVVINTNNTNDLKCHWCHSILSIKSKIGDGAVPDLILPFIISKEEAQSKIKDFCDTRKIFAKRRFMKKFTTENVFGVYFPYLVVDCNAHATFEGEGGHVFQVHNDYDGETSTTWYDIQMFNIERDFDINVDDLQVEASLDKVNKYQGKDTKNVINAILPFDVENCIKYDSSYVMGYNIEKRDLNVIDLQEKIDNSIKDIARYSIKDDVKQYESGVRWKEEKIDFKGKSVVSVFLPVWLYSYREKNNTIHYIATNARTGETMGSIPMNKLLYYICFFISFIIIFLLPVLLFRKHDYDFYIHNAGFLYSGFFFVSLVMNVNIFFYIGRRYRNKTKRYAYETETKKNITNLKRKDIVGELLEHQASDKIYGDNTDKIDGDYVVKDEDI